MGFSPDAARKNEAGWVAISGKMMVLYATHQHPRHGCYPTRPNHATLESDPVRGAARPWRRNWFLDAETEARDPRAGMGAHRRVRLRFLVRHGPPSTHAGLAGQRVCRQGGAGHLHHGGPDRAPDDRPGAAPHLWLRAFLQAAVGGDVFPRLWRVRRGQAGRACARGIDTGAAGRPVDRPHQPRRHRHRG